MQRFSTMGARGMVRDEPLHLFYNEYISTIYLSIFFLFSFRCVRPCSIVVLRRASHTCTQSSGNISHCIYLRGVLKCPIYLLLLFPFFFHLQTSLQQWLVHSNKRFCELCKTKFAFKPIYVDGAPSELGFWELIVGIFQRIQTNSTTWLRWIIVLCVWGVLLPIIARWEWQLFFEDWKLPWEHDSPWQRLGKDCMEGAMVGICVFGLALGLLALRDFIVMNAIPGIPDVSLQGRATVVVPAHCVWMRAGVRACVRANLFVFFFRGHVRWKYCHRNTLIDVATVTILTPSPSPITFGWAAVGGDWTRPPRPRC